MNEVAHMDDSLPRKKIAELEKDQNSKVTAFKTAHTKFGL